MKAYIRGDIVNPIFQAEVLLFGDDQQVIIGIGKEISPCPGTKEVDRLDFIPLLLNALKESG